MTTKLTSPLRREIEIDGEPFTVQLLPEGIRLTRKRFRGGRSVTWRSLWEQGGEELERGLREKGPRGADGHGTPGSPRRI